MKRKLCAFICLYLLGGWVLSSRDPPVAQGSPTPESAERSMHGSGFVLPVLDDNLTDNLTWDVPFNYFGRYYGAWGGYHPGEDWNLEGGDISADFGKPVYAVADGTVVKICNLGSLGQLVALKHTGSFTIPGKTANENGQTYAYRTETVNSIYSVYMHINHIPGSLYVGALAQKGITKLGYIMNPGGGPHLHFEIRHPNAVNSNNWSLVGSSSNWARNADGPTGYYLNLQQMVDGGVRDPREFIFANSHPPKSGQCSDVSFTAPKNFAAGESPVSVAISEFNGDGRLDLAVANSGSNNVSILLGTGTGSFTPANNFAAGRGPRAVAVGDFNADCKLDLAVANQLSDNVSILLGTGTGSFSAANNFAAGRGPLSVSLGDFNDDRKLDLAVANLPSANVSILLGTGTGSFSATNNVAVDSYAHSVAVGDFNSDRKSDLAVANAGSISILLGTGTGVFSAATNFGVGPNPAGQLTASISIAAGDLNGDGNLDLALANFSPPKDRVSILLGTRTGSFSAAINFASDAGPRSVAMGDFNGDGNFDLAVANFLNVSVLRGTGTGSFGAATNFAVRSLLRSVAVGDFNDDGKLDLAVANSSSGTVSILLNNGPICSTRTPTPTPTPRPVTTGTSSGVIAFSSERDGNQEVYLLDLATGMQTNLTKNPADDGYPKWSADRQRIAFSTNRDGKWQVYMMNRDGTGQRNLTKDPHDTGYVDWSPDGRSLLFASSKYGPKDEIFISSADGSNVKRLTNDPAEDVHPVWSPDGGKIAFASERDGNRQIYVMNVDGTNPIRLNRNRWYDDYPSWSPNGSQLAFASDRDSQDSNKLDIYVMNADGSNVRRVIADPRNDLHPTWSPDGKMLAFSSDRFGDRDILIVNKDGTGVRRVVSSPGNDEHPHWTAKPTAVVRNQLGMELVYVPPGSLMMGSNNGGADEKPVHRVSIKEGFYMGRYEVTQAEWQQVMGSTVQQKRNPSIHGVLCEGKQFPSSVGEGDRYPMYYVSWYEAQEFIRRLNERNEGFIYRLPTEAEWEYACRAGTTGDFGGNLDSMGWYEHNSGCQTHLVGTKQANAFGLYDMHGNVREWCEDWYHDSYTGAPMDGSAWLSGGGQKDRVLRGGAWGIGLPGLRSASRGRSLPWDNVTPDNGFRVVAMMRTQ